MKKLFLIPFLFVALISFSQPRFVVQNVTSAVFPNINDAIEAASAGDTLYLPGGGMTISVATISKTLHWIGVGHYPDSTLATGQTRITNALTFTGACDNSSFEGIEFVSNLFFGDAADDATDISIRRCRVRGNLRLRTMSTETPNINALISECVLSSLTGNNASNCLIEKCIVNRPIDHFYQSLFRFNSLNIYDYYGQALKYCTSCQFRNNIFVFHSGLSAVESCEFSNNLYSSALPFDPNTSTNSGSDNIVSVASGDIYTSVTGNAYDFSYEHDYHLKTGCAGIGSADDDSDIGIYGSSLPYKAGAVPFYPHVRSIAIDNAATNGQLGVKITVAAQER